MYKKGLLVAMSLISFSSLAQKKVQSFTVSRTIHASADSVWAVVGEGYADVAKYHGGIVSSNYVNGSTESGEGCERVCNLNDEGTKYVKEKQLEYDPENRTFKAQIYSSSGVPTVPEYTNAVYKVTELDKHTSQLTIDMTYRTKPAFMGAMAKGKFKKIIGDHAAFVEHYVTTGEAVNKDNSKTIRKQYH